MISNIIILYKINKYSHLVKRKNRDPTQIREKLGKYFKNLLFKESENTLGINYKSKNTENQRNYKIPIVNNCNNYDIWGKHVFIFLVDQFRINILDWRNVNKKNGKEG